LAQGHGSDFTVRRLTATGVRWHNVGRLSGGPTAMNRREFAKLLGVTVGASASFPTHATGREDKPTHDPVFEAADQDPPFPLSVMLWTIYRDRPFEERLAKVAEAGYRNVELVDEFRNWSNDDFTRVNRKKRELKISFDATAGMRHGIGDSREREAFLQDLGAMAVVAHKLECPRIIVLSGNVDPALSHEAQHQSCVEGLKRASEIAEKNNLTLLLENIDPEENPKYFLTSVAEGFEIIGEANQPRVKFLYDFYHEQIAEGNLIEKLHKHIDKVGVVHIADVPGRHEPGTGEINYANIFKKLASLNFKGYAAMEFLPTADPIVSLRAARHLTATATSS
jgi:hydroxypyruvate isomerase